MKREKKPKAPRETTIRFVTDECKVILMAMNYATTRGIFDHEGIPTIMKSGRIINKLKDRIEKERIKKDKVLQEIVNEEVHDNQDSHHSHAV